MHRTHTHDTQGSAIADLLAHLRHSLRELRAIVHVPYMRWLCTWSLGVLLCGPPHQSVPSEQL